MSVYALFCQDSIKYKQMCVGSKSEWRKDTNPGYWKCCRLIWRCCCCLRSRVRHCRRKNTLISLFLFFSARYAVTHTRGKRMLAVNARETDKVAQKGWMALSGDHFHSEKGSYEHWHFSSVPGVFNSMPLKPGTTDPEPTSQTSENSSLKFNSILFNQNISSPDQIWVILHV